ncbi:hypothetical protein TIFTF001_023238 [Ficus carica]|uniref:Uncharacterized protein n=1 Tax=Ficus carica TaxID=3494 RepID=A0AA88AKK1_FICCA|nr:hypothetical protein TIFTF001_023238 [Ficus carica]
MDTNPHPRRWPNPTTTTGDPTTVAVTVAGENPHRRESHAQTSMRNRDGGRGKNRGGHVNDAILSSVHYRDLPPEPSILHRHCESHGPPNCPPLWVVAVATQAVDCPPPVEPSRPPSQGHRSSPPSSKDR